MYDNTVVEQYDSKEAVKFMTDINMAVGAVKNNIIFGNGTFLHGTSTPTGNPSGTAMYKQVCLNISDLPDATSVLEAYFNSNPNIVVYSEIADAVQQYVSLSSEGNQYFTPQQAENAINLYTTLIAGRYIQLTIFNNLGFNGKNHYLIIDTAGRSIEQIDKEWKTAVKNTSQCVIGDARMALYRLIQKASFISGGNDQLVILNDVASIQYDVTVADNDGCECWDSTHYAVLSIKGEKYYCSSETDLLTQFNKHLHLIDV